MEIRTIEEIAFINPDTIKKDYPYDEIEYIDIQSVGSGYLIESKLIPLSEAPSRAKRLVKDGDTILSTVRPNRRSFLYIKNPRGNVVVSTGFAVLRAKEGIDSRYFYYTVTEQKFTDYLTLYAKGAAYPAVDTEIIQRGKIPVYALDVQKKISSILSAYDDLIENNTRRIQILEEMAQRIYKEWFIDFRFPGYEKVKFVDSEMGKIPEGWEVKKIGELLSKIKQKPRIKKEDYLEKGSIPAIDQSTSFIGGYTNKVDALHSEPLPIIVFGDHTRIIKYIDFPFASGADGTQLLYPTNKDLMPAYFYYSIKNIDLSDFAYARHFKFLKEQKIILPTSQILNNFNKLTGILLDQMSLLRKKNDRLRETRDLLLPKLISGELDVSDLDIKIKEDNL